MNKLIFSDKYRTKGSIVVTAHRGFSGRYPENTIPAFEKAAALGVDIIEFDLRGTRDNVPVVLHDPTIDRTSNGTGAVNTFTLDELKKLNFSHWQGDHAAGTHVTGAQYPDVTIPTFEETIRAIPAAVGLNIQVYQTAEPLLSVICALYKKYDLYTRGFLTVNTFADAEAVKQIDSGIHLCVLERQQKMDKDILDALHARGYMIIQPLRSYTDAAFCETINRMGFMANMFYSNTDADNRRFIAMGMKGIHSDYPDVLLKTIADIGR